MTRTTDTSQGGQPRARALDVISGLLSIDPVEVAGRSFGELGGSSLDAARSAYRLRAELGLRVTAADLLAADDIAEYLRGAAGSALAEAGPPRDGRVLHPGDLVPLTWQQRLVWYDTVRNPGSTRYHFHAVLYFDAAPAVAAMEEALRALLRRHPVLATRLVYVDGEPHQVYPSSGDADAVNVGVADPDTTPSAPAELLAVAGAHRPFDLETGPLIRWTLVRLAGNRAALVHTEHHLIHDGVSFTLLMESLSRAGSGPGVEDGYFYYAAGQARQPAEHPADGAAAKMAAMVRPDPSSGLQRHRTGGDQDPYLRLPLPANLAAAAMTTAKTAGVTLFTTLFAAFSQAVGRLHGPVRVGTAVANRPPGHERTVGMFVSAVQVRAGEDAARPLREVAREIDKAVRRAGLPITDVAAALDRRAVNREGLLDAVFSVHQQDQRNITVAGQPVRADVGYFAGAAKFPVNVIVLAGCDQDAPVVLSMEGMADYVDQDDLWALWTEFIRCLCSRCEMPPPAPAQGPAAVDVSVAVKSVADAHGASIALRDDVNTFTYSDLLDLGAAVRGLVAGTVVGLLGAPSARFFAAACAVLHGGGTYVPLDIALPASRIRTMIELSGCQLVVHVDGAMADLGAGVDCLSWDRFLAGRQTTDSTEPAHVACVMFTSGSTGPPKGVRIPRSSLARMCQWTVAELNLRPGTRLSQVTNVGFDASVWELWSALYAGAEIIVAPAGLRADPYALGDWLRGSRVDVVFATTRVAEMLMELPWDGPAHTPRVLVTGGEQLRLPGRQMPFRVLNLYGPTECTVFTTTALVDPESVGPAPIGTPLPYAFTRVVMEDGSLAPDGHGELWVGGGGLAAGYAAAPGITRARFIPDPYSPSADLVYRTGDIVRVGGDGTMDFRGRRDRQVKVSGVRIELGEIEATALGHPRVRNAVAVAEPTGELGAGTPTTRVSLVLVLEPGADERGVASDIRDVLPRYMRQIKIRFVPELTLDPRGKVDMTMLPERAPSREVAVIDTAPIDTAPIDAAAGLARTVLHTDDLGGAWFQLGGSSLDAARLVVRLSREAGIEATVSGLLDAVSVRDYLVQICGTGAASDGPPPHPPVAGAAGTPPAVGDAIAPVDLLWPALARLTPGDRFLMAQRLLESVAADIRTRLSSGGVSRDHRLPAGAVAGHGAVPGSGRRGARPRDPARAAVHLRRHTAGMDSCAASPPGAAGPVPQRRWPY